MATSQGPIAAARAHTEEGSDDEDGDHVPSSNASGCRVMEKEQEVVEVGPPATTRMAVIGLPARTGGGAGRALVLGNCRWRERAVEVVLRAKARWTNLHLARRPYFSIPVSPAVLAMGFYQRGAVPPHTAWAEQSQEAATTGAHASTYMYFHGDGNDLI